MESLTLAQHPGSDLMEASGSRPKRHTNGTSQFLVVADGTLPAPSLQLHLDPAACLSGILPNFLRWFPTAPFFEGNLSLPNQETSLSCFWIWLHWWLYFNIISCHFYLLGAENFSKCSTIINIDNDSSISLIFSFQCFHKWTLYSPCIFQVTGADTPGYYLFSFFSQLPEQILLKLVRAFQFILLYFLVT